MCNLDQIRHAIYESSELRQNIVRSIGSSTVALFAISNSEGSELLKLAGTGTLVTADNCHYILTAAHVWEESLKSAASLGITRSDNINHRYPIDTRNLVLAAGDRKLDCPWPSDREKSLILERLCHTREVFQLLNCRTVDVG
jgi:hypothetical protein